MLEKCPRCKLRYKKEGFVFQDGFRYCCKRCPECGYTKYPTGEMQKLHSYAQTHLFMFIEDWILAWMATKIDGKYVPIRSIDDLQEQMYDLTVSFALEHGISTEDPGFMRRDCGAPYALLVDQALDRLMNDEYVKSEGFELTDSGKERGNALLSKFDDEVRKDIEKLKMDFRSQAKRRNKMTVRGGETPRT